VQLEALAEANRQITICNACRYCEGYCAVYPAMELRRTFTDGDLLYLANLCFDCRACLYACQFAPPHPFGVNIPKALADVRADSYKRFTWPAALAPLLDRNLGVVLGVVAATVVAVLVLLAVIDHPGRLVQAQVGPGAFYVIAPYAATVAAMSAIVVYGLAVFTTGAIRFWREVDTTPTELISPSAFWQATTDALDLRYQRGGGNGCFYPTAQRSQARRIYHQLVFFGFLLDIASTSLAAIYQDWLGIMPPFSLLSLPVILGTLGGIGLIVGCAGLLWLKARSDPTAATQRMLTMDVAFLVVLLLAASTGMLTLIFRETGAMGVLYALHLGVVAAFFITMPYGKFAHIVYRYAALVRKSVEQRRAAADRS